MILPKHFLPPMAVNALLGTVLWTSYSEASALLIGHAQIGSHAVAVAALAGALAGGTQAIVSAPCENVRLLIEGGTSGNSWSHAWREVFRGSAHPASRHDAVEEARQTKNWMKEVGDMAGRGWHGLGYTLGKDVTGFSAFFAIFEVTRRLALQVRAGTVNVTASGESEGGKLRRHMPQFLYGLTLVTGGAIAGLSYEIIGRPWDVVRHEVRLNALAKERRTPIALLARKIEEEGFSRLFRDPLNTIPERGPRPRIYTMLKTLARVGPWGIGFLVYQAYDTGSNY
ncbi:unnamed protein product [Mycena citricolor]|uniref:Mitochondrial carrier n=1 Tax=Mycena citricolor TaxID=2018698 RepID=A0AAD2HP70_9AGAR|nr:unnamed protein product [Mycena citricolor]